MRAATDPRSKKFLDLSWHETPRCACPLVKLSSIPMNGDAFLQVLVRCKNGTSHTARNDGRSAPPPTMRGSKMREEQGQRINRRIMAALDDLPAEVWSSRPGARNVAAGARISVGRPAGNRKWPARK